MSEENLPADDSSVTKKNQLIPCKPFLKWAGGKGRLLPELLARVPEKFNFYFEPFLGAGALFFALQPKHSLLSDFNSELINCWTVVKSNVEELITELEDYQYQEDFFYQIRNLDRSPEFKNLSTIKRAARLIFLNKTCFNGLYRVNSRGEFNVPFGKYSNPLICDAKNLLACSLALQNVRIFSASFENILSLTNPNDFVFFDPPYLPLSATSNFTSYSEAGFDLESHIQLAHLCQQLNQKGTMFMLTNSCTEKTLELYKNFKISRVSVSRAINSKKEARGKVEEIIVTNY